MPDKNPISVTNADLDEDRFSRFKLITWWNQDKLRNSKFLVIGAGALGNEILKNLALLGVGRIVVVDLDRIEVTNLSRSVLFRPADIGQFKADVVAAAVRQLYPDCRVQAINANVMYEIGLGLFGWADVILAGLDNREARLWINRCAWRMNRPWIDGAIEGLAGVARVFLPGKPPCYECTLGETDWSILEKRMSCNLLTRSEMDSGKTPTTPTTSAVIAGIQVQEALKLLHGLPTLSGKGYVFEGLNHSSYQTTYTENPECMSHEVLDRIVFWPKSYRETTFAELFDFAQSQLGTADVTLEFSRDIIQKLRCPTCNAETDVYSCVGAVSAETGKCPLDATMREVITVHNFTGREPFGNRILAESGIPPFDLFIARSSDKEVGILIEPDSKQILGACNDD